MVSEGMGYLLRRALSAVVPVLWPSALSVRGAILRTSSRKDPSLPGPGESGRDRRTQWVTLEHAGSDRDAAAEGKTSEIAVVGETDDVRRHAFRHDPRGRSRRGSLLHGSLLPTGYALDPSDPDVLLLLRPDGTTAAVFSSRGVTAEGLLEAAGTDRGLRTP